MLLGSWPISLPGVPVPVKLGVAGGPLLVAIMLGAIRRIGPVIWYLPQSSNLALREFGIVLFLACVGLKGGEKFVSTLLQGDGFAWMGWAAVITLLPLIIVTLFAVLVFRLPFGNLCGLLAGSTTDPPALSFANNMTNSDAPTLTYATVYPLVMISRIIAAQIIVIFFAR
jgi:putative transport protein